MRINKYLALHSGISRRGADELILDGKVYINGQPAEIGQLVAKGDKVAVNGSEIRPKAILNTIMLNKPEGYVCSRSGQGNKTIYELLPTELHNLKTVGRLDKDSSGLLLLTNDGDLAHKLTHPSHQKNKTYQVQLDKGLTKEDFDRITKASVELNDGPSKFKIIYLNDKGTKLEVKMQEGRNRQIRRTFAKLDYKVSKLHRTQFADYKLGTLKSGNYSILS